MGNQTLEISWETILKLSLAFFAFYLIFLIKDILILCVFAFIIYILFEAPIKILEKKMSRNLAVALSYVSILAFFSFLIYLPSVSIVSEIRHFINLFPIYFEHISPSLKELGFQAFEDIESFVETLEKAVHVMSNNIFSILASVFGGIASAIFVMSISVFLSLEKNLIENSIAIFFPEKDRKFIHSLYKRSKKKVSSWFLRTVLGCIFITLILYPSLLILKTDYPLSLALLGGYLNFVPIIGPILASFLIFVVLALNSLPQAVLAVIIYAIIQQIENNIVGPILTKKLTDLSPVLVLVSIAAGAKLFGLLGAILTVPLVGMITEFTKGVLERKRKSSI